MESFGQDNEEKLKYNNDQQEKSEFEKSNLENSVDPTNRGVTSVDRTKWEKIGFHRALGGFFYSIMIALFSVIIGLFFLSFVVKYLYPWPEIQGYSKVATGFFFALIYQIFDFGTAYGIQRFIAEYRVKNPKKMIQYIQFFIWYQMFTGIVQVALISWIVLFAIRDSEFVYLSWLFLIICQKQWPGMLGTFNAVLSGMQQYNKTNILQFISSDVIQNLTSVVFILLGRWYGATHPVIGELFGMTMGAAIGTYVDDFFAMGLSMYFVGKIIEPMGLRVKDLWGLDFGWDVAKRCLIFGAQVSVVPIINSLTGTYMMLIYLKGFPQYTTFTILKDVAAGIVGIVNVGNFGTTPLIAESYMNKKIKLASFYITTSIRWNGFLMWMLTAILIAFIPMILEVILALPELQNYYAATIFIVPLLIHQLFMPFVSFPDGILIGTERVSFYTFVRVLEEILQVFFVWLFVVGLELPIIYGLSGVAFVLGFEHFFPRIIKMILAWIYIKKTLFPIKINWWQTLFGPLIASVFVYFIGEIWFISVFNPGVELIGVLPMAIVTLIIGLIAIPFLIYMPLSGLLGMWDDFSLQTFKDAVDISGPSKWMVKLFYKGAVFGASRSRLHNKFKTPWEDAAREIHELNELKRMQELKIKEI